MNVFVAVCGILIFVVSHIISYNIAAETIKSLREEIPDKSDKDLEEIKQDLKSLQIKIWLIKIWLVVAAVYLFILFLYFIRQIF